jgi:hypothetical protein
MIIYKNEKEMAIYAVTFLFYLYFYFIYILYL